MRNDKAPDREQFTSARQRSRARPSLALLGCLALIATLAGCASREFGSPSEQVTGTAPAATAAPAPAGERAAFRLKEMPADGAAASAEPPAAMPRRIIYNANVDLVVESLSAVEEQITGLVKES